MKVLKTIKLYMNGAFPRTESGRTFPIYRHKSKIEYGRLCLASRKDLRNAVGFAKSAQPKWADRSAYNRGQILYRMAEMMEGKRDELANVLKETQGLTSPQVKKLIDLSIDHLVHFAGFSDKFEQILGSKNPINGPFHNFTSPVPIGVVGHLSSDESLEELIEKISAALVSGNSIICLLGNKTEAILSILGEIFQTSDLPPGTINLLSGNIEELNTHFFSHMEINAISFSTLDTAMLKLAKELGSTHLKRINKLDHLKSMSLIEKNIEFKTYWHPIGK
jgi:acyl-CoA reductase-like NAD-dependent aldehyde dehydrogenase